MTARMHACPGGCGAMVETDRVACYPCWWRLPFDLRRRVNVAYHNRDRDMVTWSRALNDAGAWYGENPNPKQAKP